MDINKAIAFVDGTCSMARGTREEHMQLMQAMNLIKQTLEQQSVKIKELSTKSQPKIKNKEEEVNNGKHI